MQNQVDGDRLSSKIIERMAKPRFQDELGRYYVTEIFGYSRRSMDMGGFPFN